MSVAAIICEYNPFHYGHAYQIDMVRKMLGDDTVILSLMSGNAVQRGEIAVADKYDRAAAAITCGSNIVLELPFPYASSSAERFAMGAVSILDQLNGVDYLVFGSETADIHVLGQYAERRNSLEFKELYNNLRNLRLHQYFQLTHQYTNYYQLQ